MSGTYLLVAPAGWGKTTLACSLEHPTLLIDIDNKAHKMANIKPLVDQGDVTIVHVDEPLISGSLRAFAEDPKKAMTKMPMGYLKTLDLLEAVINSDPPYDKFKTVVLDSLSRLSEHLQRLLLYHAGQGKFSKDGKDKNPDMSWPAWGKYKENLENLFTTLAQMKDKNFICTAHEHLTVDKDPRTQVISIRSRDPLIDGQMREKLPSYFNEVYWLERKIRKVQGETQVKYLIHTVKSDTPARTSMQLDAVEPANLAELVEKGIPSP